MSDFMKEVVRAIEGQLNNLEEAYVTEPKKFDLRTELLSDKAKKAQQTDFEQYVEALNRVSAELDGVDRNQASNKASNFRRLKVDEARSISFSFLKAMHLDNVSDLNSRIAMDTLSYIRLSRDFGTFEDWQKDFIACCMSSLGGFAVTGYNVHLKRYMNFVMDADGSNMPVGTIPVVVLDVSEGTYYRDYLSDRRAYVHGMMKELNWNKIEQRIEKCERMAKVGF
jgi:superoxide dismutase, Fe-Mn family